MHLRRTPLKNTFGKNPFQSKTVCLGQPDEIHAEVGSGVLMRGGEWSVDEEPWGNAHVESALTCVEVMC